MGRRGAFRWTLAMAPNAKRDATIYTKPPEMGRRRQETKTAPWAPYKIPGDSRNSDILPALGALWGAWRRTFGVYINAQRPTRAGKYKKPPYTGRRRGGRKADTGGPIIQVSCRTSAVLPFRSDRRGAGGRPAVSGTKAQQQARDR